MSLSNIENAIRTNNMELFNLELNNLNDINLQNTKIKSLLMYAISYDNIEMAERLLIHGIDTSIYDNNFKMIKLVKLRGWDLNIKDKKGESCLHWSVNHNKLDTFKFLIKLGADLNCTDNDDRTVLSNIVFYNRYDMLEFIINHGFDLNNKDNLGKTILHYIFACRSLPCLHLYNMAKLVLAHLPDPNIQDKYGNTPLMCAVMERNNKIELLELLLKYGANPNIQNNQNSNILHYVMWSFDIDIINIFLKYGANPNIQNFANHYPLYIAAVNNNLNAVKILLTYIGNVQNDLNQIINSQNTTYNDGETMLHHAVHHNNLTMVELILKYGGDPNIQNNKGETSLHLAILKLKCKKNNKTLSNDISITNMIINLLLSYGANADIKNKKGKTASDCLKIKK